MPIYSFGVDSPLKFELSDEYADAFNRANKAFFTAQENHLKKHGSKWTPDQSLWIEWSDEEEAAFNAFDNILRKALELHGRPVHETELIDDYLIKN